ncbi:MAG: sulfotransferase [Actinobacteria bacterium]|nr:sulfotransferase [Actinomycetota bacterium]
MLANAVIVGVEKAGTTSLFRALSAHPDVAPALVKETRYFHPVMYGTTLEPLGEYERYFAEAGDQSIRLEASPRYFYGGRALAGALKETLGDIRVIVVLREPVSRFLSFFASQKARLRIPEKLTVEEYLAHSDAMDEADFLDPENHRWFGLRGGFYADWLPAWHEAFGAKLAIVDFDELVHQPEATLRRVSEFLGLEPEPVSNVALPAENRTASYRNRQLQWLALRLNRRLEVVLRRHYRVKQRLRGVYRRLNGRTVRVPMPDEVKTLLTDRYREPNARLSAEMVAWGESVPEWLRPFLPAASPSRTA